MSMQLTGPTPTAKLRSSGTDLGPQTVRPRNSDVLCWRSYILASIVLHHTTTVGLSLLSFITIAFDFPIGRKLVSSIPARTAACLPFQKECRKANPSPTAGMELRCRRKHRDLDQIPVLTPSEHLSSSSLHRMKTIQPSPTNHA